MDSDPLLSFSLPQTVALVIAAFALVASGFVSGSEISYFSLTPQQLDDDDDEHGPERNAGVRRLLSMPERLLATILIANNLVNVTIVILCNFALGPVFEGMGAVWSFVLQSVILTFLILLFGEIIPKLYAQTRPLSWAHMASPVLLALVRLLYAPASLLVRSSSIVHKVVEKKPQNISADELSQALELTDVEKRDDKRMLQEILKFGDTTASEIMTPRVDITDIEISSDFSRVMEVVLEAPRHISKRRRLQRSLRNSRHVRPLRQGFRQLRDG